jgi:ribonuclease Z
MWLDKYSMSPQAAVMSGTQGHTTPAAFGKVMSIVRPRMAVASHFQNDFDTAAAVEREIRSQYNGPLNLGLDFMVWNITKDKLTTRMAVANPESFPPPAQVPAQPPEKNPESYQWDPFSFSGLEKETSAVTNEVVERFNVKNGTDIEPVLSNIPFKKPSK